MTLEHAAPTTTLPPGTYRLDPAASTVGFSIRKLGFITVTGSFAIANGEFTVSDDLAASSIRASIAVDSFTTPSSKRDAAVKSAKLLDATAHPTITFSSTAVRSDAAAPVVEGVLTVRGQSAPVALTIEEAANRDGSVRVRATVDVDRRTFGVTALKGVIGSVIHLTIDAVGVPAAG